MKTQSPDTHPDVERLQIEGHRRMSAAEKFRKIADLNAFLDMLALADVRRRYPEADERECRLRVASRRIPADLMRKAFGWDVEEKGY
jgi:hypothetical protein